MEWRNKRGVRKEKDKLEEERSGYKGGERCDG